MSASSSVTAFEDDVQRTESLYIEEDPNLPYRTLNNNAVIDEFTQETATGTIIKRTVSQATGHEVDYKLVTFEIGDPENPKNWSKLYKWYCTMLIALVCFVVAFASAVVTADIVGVSEEFGVSDEVSLLSITLFVIGFGVGPMVFAEVLGRKIIYVTTLGVAVIFIIPCALAKNIGTLLVCRLIDEIAFSAPMTLVGGSLADLWRKEERGVPMAAFSAAPFLGPAIGPLVGGFISDHFGWRWLYWVMLMLAGAVYLLMTFTVPETYAPTLLSRRAAKLRAKTGDSAYVTEHEIDKRPFGERIQIFMIRPFQLLFRELIVFLISLYMSVLYGLLYMFFVAYPIVFQEGKGFSASNTGLMFIPLAIGVVASAVCSPMINKHYLKLRSKHGEKPPPELRLIPMMCSCWFIPIGLFIFAWTSYPSLSWWGPAIGGFPVGF
ncbi:hypothetical protein BZG36_03475, partial [Bifiguratus adelaidae]